jgi:MoaA/NifB/PqqE/SkfB family radical SAM enzyme
MNPFSGEKILSFYHEALSIKSGEIPIPRMVSFWPTTVCNLGCSFCLYAKENHSEKNIADTNDIIRMIDNLADVGVKSLEFSGGGEPTIHPDFNDLAKYAHRRGLRTGLFTNGTRLGGTDLSTLRYVRVGLDAADCESYDAIKKPGRPRMFADVVNNIEFALLGRGDRKRPRIGLKFLLNAKNKDSINAMIKIATDLGVDYVQFKGEHSGPDVMTIEQARQATDRIGYLRGLNQLCDRPDIIGSPIPQKPGPKCWLSPIHTVIGPTGDVWICCFMRKNRIGNIFQARFETFWGSEHHRQLIENIDLTECGKVDCRWHGFNRDMEKVLSDDGADLDFI